MKRLFLYLSLAVALSACADRQEYVRPPLMGWNSWNAYMVDISDSIIMNAADMMIAKGLKDAGYEESEVKFIKAKLDYDDGRYEYEIEFRAEGNLEYDYTINAENGKIVEFDRDYEGRDRFEFNLFAFLRNLFKNLFRKLA